MKTHSDNGKSAMAAILFNTLGEAHATRFFSRMSIATHGPARDEGHTGNFFNILWALPGISLSGPQATGAWMNEFGFWYFDLARRSDGSFVHLGREVKEKYRGWDCSGAYLLAYALPLKHIRLTGKKKSTIKEIDSSLAKSLIDDGRGWSRHTHEKTYDNFSNEQLLEKLSSWSPVVRERAATALGRRENVAIAPLLKLLRSEKLEARYGACRALEALGSKAAEAVDPLIETLRSEDVWLRISAAKALRDIGKPAMKAVPELLTLLAQVDTKKDPRSMQQRYFSIILFYHRGGMLGKSLEGVDREALYKAVRAGLKNQDGRARSLISMTVYRNLNEKDIKPLLPDILEAVKKSAPSGIMFAEGVRLRGLQVLARHHVEEGMQASIDYIRNQNAWRSPLRTPVVLKALLLYGQHAQKLIPQLTKLEDEYAAGKFGRAEHAVVVAKDFHETIKAIQASKEKPTLIRIE